MTIWIAFSSPPSAWPFFQAQQSPPQLGEERSWSDRWVVRLACGLGDKATSYRAWGSLMQFSSRWHLATAMLKLYFVGDFPSTIKLSWPMKLHSFPLRGLSPDSPQRSIWTTKSDSCPSSVTYHQRVKNAFQQTGRAWMDLVFGSLPGKVLSVVFRGVRRQGCALLSVLRYGSSISPQGKISKN